MNAFQSSPGLSLIVRDANSFPCKESKVSLHRSIQSVFLRSSLSFEIYIASRDPRECYWILSRLTFPLFPASNNKIELDRGKREKVKRSRSKLSFSSLIDKDGLIWILTYSRNQSFIEFSKYLNFNALLFVVLWKIFPVEITSTFASSEIFYDIKRRKMDRNLENIAVHDDDNNKSLFLLFAR